ncbi:MAG: outer membrane lipoprotein chaperone LolA [Rubrivivax sp.]
MRSRRKVRAVAAAWLLGAVAGAAQADAVDQLRRFVAEVKAGSADFEQIVTTPDGAARKPTRGFFAFLRPDRFRFDYTQPYEQQIVSDGRKVWLHDPDLQQVTVRRLDQALGATPAALLTGGSLERDFTLVAQPASEQLEWVRATPKASDGAFQWMAVGFRGDTLAAVEILDRFGQRTRLSFRGFTVRSDLTPSAFSFTPPAGTSVVEQ